MNADIPAIAKDNLVAALHKCRQKRDLDQCRLLHAYIRQQHLESHPVIGNCLVPLLVDCGNLHDARIVFDRLSHRRERSWTSLISGYSDHGEPQHAFHLYQKMQQDGHAQPTTFTYVALLNTCARLSDVDQSREIHAETIKRGFENGLHVGSSLVDAYTQGGSLAEARVVFNRLRNRDAILWTALIAGYAKHGLDVEVLDCFQQMQQGGVPADSVTFLCSLKACAIVGAADTGQEIHTQIMIRGLEQELFLGSTLVDLYGKCGLLSEAHQVFDRLSVRDIVSWNALIAGYAAQGLGKEVLNFFKQMLVEGVSVDAVTLLCSLKACDSVGCMETGQQIHIELTKRGLEAELHLGSALVDMYGKHGFLADSQVVFDRMSVQDAVTWNALIAGYTEHGFSEEALQYFKQMKLKGVSLTTVTYILCLKACSIIGALEIGQEIHAEIRQSGLESDLFVGNMLIEMYGKCGFVAEGQKVFDKLPTQEVSSWIAIIKAYGENHEGSMAVKCFEKMRGQGVQPDSITFTCLLAACSHASLVLEGQQYFKLMIEEHRIEPTLEHYACMVDLLARSGHIYVAEKLLAAMKCPPSSVILIALLNACKIYGKLQLGQRCFQQLVEVKQEDAAAYLLMADLYANAGRFSDANKLEDMRKHKGAKKKLGCASIEVNKMLYEFIVNVNRIEEVVEMPELQSSCIRVEGYVPDVDLVSGHI